MDFEEIKKLVELVEQSDISHLTLDENGSKIEIKKEKAQAITTVALPQEAPIQAPMHPNTATSENNLSKSEDQSDNTNNFIEIKAQMVGTFYNLPNPDSPVYVKAGDSISTGQIICIIEAMKLFNEIESEVSGTIEKVCVENGMPVEFGQTLFLIKP